MLAHCVATPAREAAINRLQIDQVGECIGHFTVDTVQKHAQVFKLRPNHCLLGHCAVATVSQRHHKVDSSLEMTVGAHVGLAETLPLHSQALQEMRQTIWHSIVDDQGYDAVTKVKAGVAQDFIRDHVHGLLPKQIKLVINIIIAREAENFLNIIIFELGLQETHQSFCCFLLLCADEDGFSEDVFCAAF